jgi:hypothetical protein
MSALEPTIEAGAVWSLWMHVSIGPLLSDEVGSSDEGHVAVPNPSWIVRWGPEPLGTWQRWIL